MSETFYELLISNVKNTRVLWDLKHKHYYNRLLVDREWSRIAADLQETKEVVKNKWKNLRDRFKKELNKIPKCRSGDEGENALRYNGTWCHFEAMLFLKHILTPKVTEGNIENSGNTSNADQLSQERETDHDITSQSPQAKSDEEFDDDELSQPKTDSCQPATKRVTRVPRQQPNDDLENALPGKDTQITPIVIQRKRKAPAKNEGNLDEEFLRLEAKKVALLEKNDDDDEDINFFKSLLPHVRQLPSLSKLSFKSQVQNLLAAEIWKVQNYRHTYNTNTNTNANPAFASSHHQPSYPSSAQSPASNISPCLSGPLSPVEIPQASTSGYQQYQGLIPPVEKPPASTSGYQQYQGLQSDTFL